MQKKEFRLGKRDGRLTAYLHDDLTHLDNGGQYREKRPAILVIPGGGYRFCSERETDPIALKFFALGYETFTLSEYSCNEDILYSNPEAEAAEALNIIRHTPGVDLTRIAGIGFSAGAHLLGAVAAHGKLYSETPGFNAIIMSYPVVTAGEFAHRPSFDRITGKDSSKLDYYSLEKQIDSDFPATFIWSTTDDQTVPVENSLLLYNAIREKGVKVELHIFAEGRHGLSLATNETGFPSRRVSGWFDEAVTFLNETLNISDYHL